MYVLHLYLLFGGVVRLRAARPGAGRLGFAGALGVLALMLPVLLAAAWLWRTGEAARPPRGALALVFVSDGVPLRVR